MNNKVKLHEGYIGRTRSGEKVNIINRVESICPHYTGDNEYSYWPDGCYFFSNSFESPDDIIGPWEEPVEPANNYNDGLWNGSFECPVHKNTTVNVKFSAGIV